MKTRGTASKQGELEVAERAREVAERVGKTFSRALLVYTELAPDGRVLTRKEAATARQQLLAVTQCLRDLQNDDDIVDWLADCGRRQRKDKDIRPTIAVTRMMQRSYGLALSSNPSRRKLAIAAKELAEFAVPLYRFWREF